ncbi:MAG: hypothetical protein ABIV28_04240 [Longimicrobiales bacterium]
MNYIIGFAVWITIGVVIAVVMRMFYKVAGAESWLTFVFGFFGAFIGGMLGTAGYVHHDPNPFRFGGMLGALLGALFFTACYHFTEDKGV